MLSKSISSECLQLMLWKRKSPSPDISVWGPQKSPRKVVIHDSPHDTRCRKKLPGATEYAIQRYNALDFDKGHEYVSILSSIASPSEIWWDEVLCSEGGKGPKQILGPGIGSLAVWDISRVENDWSKWSISRNSLEIWEERELPNGSTQHEPTSLQCHCQFSFKKGLPITLN